jgi:hypothetical protein
MNRVFTLLILCTFACAYASIQSQGDGSSQQPIEAASRATASAIGSLYSQCRGTVSNVRVYDMQCSENGGYFYCHALATAECN